MAGEKCPALLINSSRPASSLFNYAVNIAGALGKESRLVHLAMNPSDPAWGGVVELERGFSFGVYTLDAVMNNLAPRVFYPNTAALAREVTAAGAPVHSTSIDVPVLARGSTAVVTIHDHPRAYFSSDAYSSRSRYRVALRLRSLLYYRFRWIIATSQHVANGLVEEGVRGRVFVAYPPVSDVFRPSGTKEENRRFLGLPLDKHLVLSISSGEKRKNLKTVELTMGHLGSDYVLVRVGPRVHCERQIHLRSLSTTDLARLYSASDVLLFPSLEEGFGSPVAESMTMGVPVVGSDIEVMREITAGAATLIEPMDHVRFAAAIRSVTGGESPTVGTGQSRAREFSPSSAAAAVLAIYAAIRAG
jgi:alpha-1,6-mannosyltransferase